MSAELDLWIKTFGDGVKSIRYFDHSGSYEGWGCAIATMTDGTFRTADYSHCSCGGPEDDMSAVEYHATIEDARRATPEHQIADLDARGSDWSVES